jgi:hypothetical protein
VEHPLRDQAISSVVFTQFSADQVDDQTLAMMITLGQPDGEATWGALQLCFTLTACDGRQVGGLICPAFASGAPFSVDLPLPPGLLGPHRLKATLSAGENLMDSARIGLVLR